MIRVRRASDSDLDWIEDADDAFGAPLEYEQHTWWVAHHDGDPVAYAGIRRLDGPNAGTTFFARAWVAPAYRGIGLHRRLIRARQRACAVSGDVAVTYVARWNLRSANALLHEGFRLYEPTHPWGLRDALYLIWTPPARRRSRS